jgi:hypothetical protein
VVDDLDDGGQAVGVGAFHEQHHAAQLHQLPLGSLDLDLRHYDGDLGDSVNKGRESQGGRSVVAAYRNQKHLLQRGYRQIIVRHVRLVPAKIESAPGEAPCAADRAEWPPARQSWRLDLRAFFPFHARSWGKLFRCTKTSLLDEIL